jgi:hypothetical protein
MMIAAETGSAAAGFLSRLGVMHVTQAGQLSGVQHAVAGACTAVLAGAALPLPVPLLGNVLVPGVCHVLTRTRLA